MSRHVDLEAAVKVIADIRDIPLWAAGEAVTKIRALPTVDADALREAREAEREACAKVADRLACLGPRDEGYSGTCCPGCHAMVAAKIRARGDA